MQEMIERLVHAPGVESVKMLGANMPNVGGFTIGTFECELFRKTFGCVGVGWLRCCELLAHIAFDKFVRQIGTIRQCGHEHKQQQGQRHQSKCFFSKKQMH